MTKLEVEHPSSLIQTRGLTKSFGKEQVLRGIDLDIAKGRIVGLIGPNGAGKTTLLKCLLGLSTFQGSVNILGMQPIEQRTALLEQVCFIADTAILPKWMKVSQALDYLQGVHPRFNLERAKDILATTNINAKKRVSELSKGMITQLHLALVMAIDAKLLVLDEPTLGLDLLYRKEFYARLLNDYFDEDRTIIITTHQVEEVEGLLTDLIFIRDGQLILDMPMDQLEQRFVELEVRSDQLDAARALQPVGERPVMGGSVLIYKEVNRIDLQALGKIRTPSVADLFVATMQAAEV